jgi:aromatic ring-opening dioxygenase catalytic subunit (LigB family)
MSSVPVFFFAHGSPVLVFSEDAVSSCIATIGKLQGPNGPLSRLWPDFGHGPALLRKYEPKGILVYSVHWEPTNERLGMYLDFFSL